MDDGRFDSLVKALAEGRSRRSVLKGLLGLGGAAIVGTAVVESDTDAAVRRTPTPTPVKCPGQQTNVGGVCTCKVPPAPGPNKCGPACCTGKHGDPIPGPPTHTECCDNACCNGTCLGEEGCCPTNTRAGGLPPTHIICDGPTGKVCVEGTCCTDFDCGEGDPCQVCDPETHTCRPRCDEATEVCCTEQAGPGVCVTGDCCLGIPSCDEGEVCCQATTGTVCVAGETCPPPCEGDDDCADCATCDDGLCSAGCRADQICCDAECLSAEGFFTCGDGCCAVEDTCCEGECCTGECLRYSQAPDVCCTTLACLEGEDRECCPNVADYKCCGTQGCCTSSQCNEEADVCCDAGTFACGTGDDACCDTEDEKCCDGACIPASECCESTDGNCDPACALDASCDCSDPANDGYGCNGGLANGGGVCGCGYCVVPLDGCPCGCAGDTECVQCAGEMCEIYNQGGPCNGGPANGGGICQGEWCVEVDCTAACAIGDRCGTIENGCECTCSPGLFCMPDSTFCCPGTGLGTDANCAYCGDVCPSGTSCVGGTCVNTCSSNGGSCNGDGDCCSGLCQFGSCVSCKISGGSCSVTTDCCRFYACVGGRCFSQ